MRQKTLNRYKQTTGLFLSFTLRAACDVLKDGMELPIAPIIIEYSDDLIKVLKSNNSEAIEHAIHRLIMGILDLPSKPGEKFICPLKRFVIYASVMPSGKIEDPKGINATLTELKWPMRATTFGETILQSKDGIHNNDTEL
jgi:hypothetical protein